MSTEKNEMMQHAQAVFKDPDAAARYANAENATRPFCKILVEKSGLANVKKDVHVFDLATGTGAAIQELYDAVPKEQWEHLKVLGADSSPAMLEYLKARGEKSEWPGLKIEVMDGNKLDLPEATFTHIFVTFGIFVMPNAIPALMKSLKPGGFFGITTWRSLAWQPILDTSISKMKNKPPHVSASEVLNTMYSGRDWGSSEYLEQQFREAGCEKIETEQRVITAKVGTPKLVTETMQFPLKMITSVWKDDKKDEWLKELNEVMSKEVTEMAGGDGQVEMTFEGLVAWGYKK